MTPHSQINEFLLYLFMLYFPHLSLYNSGNFKNKLYVAFFSNQMICLFLFKNSINGDTMPANLFIILIWNIKINDCIDE
ncbi:MAG: hypothetical protein C6W54_11500 [Bacillaceae bacterium]|uniref:Uncharacterized protein n=1 Tax=Aeribacillus pallidus TaxID=33936 RepID=A0A163YAV9_9BACI|nr:hypothetical protein A3Q35_03135 [Aeribacillus pallidus]KZN96060.1 hypothetical protein AZI98_10670 [Aeribacillus pallidus]REJ22686.1 MAG: hypothetical protein C6W54_11500 [Bacillaceae bacterium]